MTENNLGIPIGWEDLLDALRSVVAPHDAIYAAGPLNTGPRLYGPLPIAPAAIRAANDLDMKTFVMRLRQTQGRPVIDTSRLRPVGWTDRQIGDFFLAVLGELAREAWFMDGWEYSRGATKEFEHCVRLSIPCFRADGQALIRQHGIRLLAAAIQNIEAHGSDATRLRARLQALSALAPA